MSIWSSVGAERTVMALDGHEEAANYRAEGEPTIEVDVAVTVHDHVRLALWDEAGMDVCVLLSPEALDALADKIVTARTQRR